MSLLFINHHVDDIEVIHATQRTYRPFSKIDGLFSAISFRHLVKIVCLGHCGYRGYREHRGS